jgi:hypothetical protein
MVSSMSFRILSHGPELTTQDKKRSVGGEKYERRREGPIDLDGSGGGGD